MIEITGDLWEWHKHGAIIAITTSGAVDRFGKALMQRGCARQASDRFPDVPFILGELITRHGNHVFDLGYRLVSFPVEASPYEVPDLRLIERSCRELVALATDQGWNEVVVPRPGCGSGGLEWGEVQPVLERYFDQRFKLIAKGEGPGGGGG